MTRSAVSTAPALHIDPAALADFERFARRTTGSRAAARRATRAVSVRITGWQAIDCCAGSDRERLYRAALYRPELLAPDPDQIDADADWLPRLLAMHPVDGWIAWSMQHLAGWQPTQLARLSGVGAGAIGADVEAAQHAIQARLGCDAIAVASDPLRLAHLQERLQELGHRIVATAADRSDALLRSNLDTPDMIVLEMSDELDAGLVSMLGNRHGCPILVLVSNVQRTDESMLPPRARLLEQPFDQRTLALGCTRALLQLP